MLGKLILLQQVREDAARRALAAASEAERRARAAERGADDRRRTAAEALAEAQGPPPAGEAPSAQVLQLADVRRRGLQDVLVALEVHLAELCEERITAEEARERMRADWNATRERRKKLEERLGATRREARRRRDRAAESAQDDLPPRGGGGVGTHDR